MRRRAWDLCGDGGRWMRGSELQFIYDKWMKFIIHPLFPYFHTISQRTDSSSLTQHVLQTPSCSNILIPHYGHHGSSSYWPLTHHSSFYLYFEPHSVLITTGIQYFYLLACVSRDTLAGVPRVHDFAFTIILTGSAEAVVVVQIIQSSVSGLCLSNLM